MDRIQAGDLKTFLSLRTEATGQITDYPQLILQTDQAELERLGASQGLGYELHDNDDELRATFNDLGISEFISGDAER
jgi:hypothetical protein